MYRAIAAPIEEAPRTITNKGIMKKRNSVILYTVTVPTKSAEEEEGGWITVYQQEAGISTV